MLIYAVSHRLIQPISLTFSSTTTQRPSQDSARSAPIPLSWLLTAHSPLFRLPLPSGPKVLHSHHSPTLSHSSPPPLSFFPASKEWVIPAKPKPGRKPKKEVPPPKEAQEVCHPDNRCAASRQDFSPSSLQGDSKGRRVQNRYDNHSHHVKLGLTLHCLPPHTYIYINT